MGRGVSIGNERRSSKINLHLRIGFAARCEDVAMPFRKFTPLCLGYTP